MTHHHLSFAAGLLAGVLAIAIHTGCSVESANSVQRSVAINVGGVYRYDADSCGANGKFVSVNSGRQVISLDLRQTGDQLEAIDNNGIIFRGTIGNVVENSASFNLEGSTTAGNSVLISGSISVSGDSGLMQGTWVEDTFFATLCGSSSGQSVITNRPPATNTNSNTNGSIIISRAEQERLLAYRQLAWWLDRGQG